MNKVSLLRQRIHEQYNNDDLTNAANTGEALLREHWVNPGEKSMSYADDLFNLACIYDTLGNWERAIFLYYESAREVVSMNGESLDFSYRLNNLAALLSTQGFSPNAYHLLQHVTRIYRNNLSQDDPLLADGLYNMANVAAEIGKTSEAMTLHKEALAIRKKSGEKADIVNSLHSMAFILEDKNDSLHALIYASDAMLEARDDSFYTAEYYLAELYDACEEFEQSSKYYRDVLTWTETRVGRLHSSYLNVSLKLAHSVAQCNKPYEALEIFKEIQQSFLKIDGEEHLFYANCLRSMALIYRQIDDPDKAGALMMKSIKIRQINNEDALEDFLFMFEMYMSAGNSDKALSVLVYMLMRFELNKEKITSAVNETISKSNKQQSSLLLSAIETLNNREVLIPIIKRWEDWEKGIIND